MAPQSNELPTVFERIYQVVRLIPPGRVATYGQVAAIVSHCGAARTVGWALHALNEGTDVPWHRVINASGRSSLPNDESDLPTQRTLLEEEGIRFDSQDRVDLAIYQWEGLDWPEIEDLRAAWFQT
jgi:methylated-DNA-protein-cysteine methyltransferase-like protein